MVLSSYLRVALLTALNVVFNAATLGRFVFLEGRGGASSSPRLAS